MNLRQSEEFGAMMGKRAGMFIASPEQLHDPFAKPSWFPWKTKSMIDKATEKEWDRMDKEEAWSDADQKILSDIGNDFTREGINKRLNYYLDRRHGVVKNPYLSALDAADLDGSDYDYESVVEDSLPWRKGVKNDDLFDLLYEAQHPMYKDTANRQQLFDKYYPHLNLAKSVVKKKPLSKSASFGELMGKRTMGKQAGLFWKKLDKPVGIKSLWGPHTGATSMRLDAERTMEPRLLTRLFSSPDKDYDRLFSNMKNMIAEGDDTASTPEGRVMLASLLLPKMYPSRYKTEGDSPIGNEDIFENSVYVKNPSTDNPKIKKK